MSNCPLTSGRLATCRKHSAGIKAIYLIPYGDTAYEPDITGMEVSSINNGALTVYKFGLHSQVGSGVSTVNNDPTGSKSYEQVVTAQLHGLSDASLLSLLDEIDSGRWHVIVEDVNDKFMLYGNTNGMYRTGENNTGTAGSDFNGATLTLTAIEPKGAYYVDPTWIDDVDITIDDGSTP